MPADFDPPPPGVVRVWLAHLDQPPLPLAQLGAALSPDESARSVRLAFDDVRARWIVGRGLLRRVLGAALDIAPAAVRLADGINGRPVLADAPGAEGDDAPRLAFNLSHSRDRLAIAVASVPAGAGALAIGVDIEALRVVSHQEGIARRVFDDDERRALDAHPEGAARTRAFHRLWTRKEACMKATGAGLTLPPHTFHVDERARVQQVQLPPHACAPRGLVLAVHDLDVGPDAAGALAIEGGGWTVEVRTAG